MALNMFILVLALSAQPIYFQLFFPCLKRHQQAQHSEVYLDLLLGFPRGFESGEQR